MYVGRVAFGRWGENPALDAARLRAHLSATIESNIATLRTYRLPRLRQSGVGYFFDRRLPGGGPIADVLALLELGHGKCDSLVAYDVADRIVRDGVPARVFLRFEGVRDGQLQFHALTELPGGIYLDPSRELGMR